MTQAKQGDNVLIHYTGKLEDGNRCLTHSSRSRPPPIFHWRRPGHPPVLRGRRRGMAQGNLKLKP